MCCNHKQKCAFSFKNVTKNTRISVSDELRVLTQEHIHYADFLCIGIFYFFKMLLHRTLTFTAREFKHMPYGVVFTFPMQRSLLQMS